MNNSPPSILTLCLVVTSTLSSADLAFCLWLWAHWEERDARLQQKERKQKSRQPLRSNFIIGQLHIVMLGLRMSVSAGKEWWLRKVYLKRQSSQSAMLRGAYRHGERKTSLTIWQCLLKGIWDFALICMNKLWQKQLCEAKKRDWGLNPETKVYCVSVRCFSITMWRDYDWLESDSFRKPLPVCFIIRCFLSKPLSSNFLVRTVQKKIQTCFMTGQVCGSQKTAWCKHFPVLTLCNFLCTGCDIRTDVGLSVPPVPLLWTGQSFSALQPMEPCWIINRASQWCSTFICWPDASDVSQRHSRHCFSSLMSIGFVCLQEKTVWILSVAASECGHWEKLQTLIYANFIIPTGFLHS